MNKNWVEAERRYQEVLDRYPESGRSRALYWKGVSHYKKTNDHTVLGQMPDLFRQKYPDSTWVLKTAAWEHCFPLLIDELFHE
jgi:TolA-binding protein